MRQISRVIGNAHADNDKRRHEDECDCYRGNERGKRVTTIQESDEILLDRPEAKTQNRRPA